MANVKLTPELITRISDMISYGFTQKRIEQRVGLSNGYLSDAKKTNPELKKAINVSLEELNQDLKANMVLLAFEGGKNDNVKLGATKYLLDTDVGSVPVDDTPSDDEIIKNITLELKL